jgi:signal transduction histidine kinase
MFGTLASGLKGGFRRLRDNPQLAYTILLAVVIFFAFLFVAYRFVGIAQDAQERLINVRAGSIQDVFSTFVGKSLNTPAELTIKIQEIVGQNETIKDFDVLRLTLGKEPTVIASLTRETGSTFALNETDTFLLHIISGDVTQSFTAEEDQGGERFFKTARAITDNNTVVGMIITRQTLSAADQQINDNIRNSIFVLFVVLILIMLLFLRHSKIIDYTVLYRRLKEVDELKDDFISMASHELRTPLTVIRGYAEILSESQDVKGGDRNTLEHIEDASEHLAGLIEDMLDVSRMEQGRMTFDLKVFDPKELVGSIVETFQPIAKQKNLALSFEVKDSRAVSTDETRLRQVIVNLVGNAVKYTPQGEVKVKIYTEKDNLIIRVIDSGIGMTEVERQNLFQKFYRIKSQETLAIQGTGLGLWITKQIVEKMGGSISVESIKGVGSHFIVSLPIVKN